MQSIMCFKTSVLMKKWNIVRQLLQAHQDLATKKNFGFWKKAATE